LTPTARAPGRRPHGDATPWAQVTRAKIAELTVGVLLRPWLWATAVRQTFALAPSGWWRRWPYLPFPDPAYVAFRLETMYGDGDRPPSGDDLVAYLRWCRMQRRALG
jgi:hypothetical protein